MAEKITLRSEGAAIDDALNELQRENQVREISGWDSGFANLNRALDGILPGLYVLVGPPSVGKTSFAKQLLDQVAERNQVTAIFFSFTESKKELRLKTLARLSGLDNREIRRGSAYLLHWYGVPRFGGKDPEQLPPSWEKLKRATEEAKGWLDRTYLVECARDTSLADVENQVRELIALYAGRAPLIVIDECQRLGDHASLDARLPVIVEQLHQAATAFKAPLIAIWPDLEARAGLLPQRWSEKIPVADVVLVMDEDQERTRNLTEPNQGITLHIVKNRGGERGKLGFDFLPAFSKFQEV